MSVNWRVDLQLVLSLPMAHSTNCYANIRYPSQFPRWLLPSLCRSGRSRPLIASISFGKTLSLPPGLN